MKNKCSFEEFLRSIYELSMLDYLGLSLEEQKAVELDYVVRYGSPIIWFKKG